MGTGLATVAYLGAAILFIRSLGGLSDQETARKGNLSGIVGMVIAVAATAALAGVTAWNGTAWALVVGPLAVGGLIGALLASRVAMTAMPQLVAQLHSFVGLAAVLVGISSYVGDEGHLAGAALVVHLLEIWLGVAIGAITFTGSIIAWAKLRGSLSGSPLLLPGRHLLNAVMVLLTLGLAVPFILWTVDPAAAAIPEVAGMSGALVLLVIMTVITSLLGVHLVMAIGGADMPVVVSLLNSYSGWAAAAAGFMLSNDLLIVTGALVGSSGAILSYIMCAAMNRSIWNVVFGGFGTGDDKPKGPRKERTDQGEVHEASADGVAALLLDSKRVIIVPGYGLAVARAQHLVHELTTLLSDRNIDVRYAIHPVAGRLPGHMNVLLAEAGVPYDIVFEMDEINDDMPRTDTVLVIGANDVVNPDAQTDESSPIYGMPVIEAWKAGNVVVFKRSLGTGYAGVQNPLFFLPNSRMLFGNADETVRALVAALS